MRRKSYVLTVRAAADLSEARIWSRARWGKELTNRYFVDLHEGAQYMRGVAIPMKHMSAASRM